MKKIELEQICIGFEQLGIDNFFNKFLKKNFRLWANSRFQLFTIFKLR